MLEGHNRKYLQTGGTKMPLPVTLILASPLDREAGPECDFLSRSSRCLLLTLPVSEFEESYIQELPHDLYKFLNRKS
jgi:hypothetical protein